MFGARLPDDGVSKGGLIPEDEVVGRRSSSESLEGRVLRAGNPLENEVPKKEWVLGGDVVWKRYSRGSLGVERSRRRGCGSPKSNPAIPETLLRFWVENLEVNWVAWGDNTS